MSKDKKDKKSKGSRKSSLKSMINKGQVGRDFGQYVKYGDIPEYKVHQGTATLMGNPFTDSDSRGAYGRAVKTGEGKVYFVYKGRTYKTTNSSGTTSELVRT